MFGMVHCTSWGVHYGFCGENGEGGKVKVSTGHISLGRCWGPGERWSRGRWSHSSRTGSLVYVQTGIEMSVVSEPCWWEICSWHSSSQRGTLSVSYLVPVRLLDLPQEHYMLQIGKAQFWESSKPKFKLYVHLWLALWHGPQCRNSLRLWILGDN